MTENKLSIEDFNHFSALKQVFFINNYFKLIMFKTLYFASIMIYIVQCEISVLYILSKVFFQCIIVDDLSSVLLFFIVIDFYLFHFILFPKLLYAKIV